MNFWENPGQRGDQPPRDGAQTYAGQGGADRPLGAADIADRLGSFGNKSEEQLMSELIAAVNRMKSDGSFDPASLDRLYATAYPFLSESQRARMRGIIDMLKR